MISQVCLNFSLIPPPHICPLGESPAPVTGNGSSSGTSSVQPIPFELVDLTGNTQWSAIDISTPWFKILQCRSPRRSHCRPPPATSRRRSRKSTLASAKTAARPSKGRRDSTPTGTEPRMNYVVFSDRKYKSLSIRSVGNGQNFSSY